MLEEAQRSPSVRDPNSGALRKANTAAKIAFVHEWLITYAGSEKVLQAMLEEFPTADLFCVIDFLSPANRAKLQGRKPRTTFLQKVPFIEKYYKYFLLFMPMAIEQYDMSDYDIIISNSHAVAKGIIVGPDQLHICYCYSPMRYAWDLHDEYLSESGFRGGLPTIMARAVLHWIRIWDVRSSFSVDHYIACSKYISRRIQKIYRRDAAVIYPNVSVDDFVPGGQREDFYLTSSRLTPYKRVHLIVEAFAQMPARKLVVIGAGPQFDRIKRTATSNVTVLGYQEHPVLLAHMQTAKAFIFAAEEDFGIAPLEAQACGTPVLAFSKGGARETVVDGVTGLHFHEQTREAICDVVERFEALPTPLEPMRIRAHANRFSTGRFKREFTEFVRRAWTDHTQMLETGSSTNLGLLAPGGRK